MYLVIQSDDAFAWIVDKLRRPLLAILTRTMDPMMYGLPNIVWEYLVVNGYSRNQHAEYCNDLNLEDLWRAFYDAAWRLCRTGIFRVTASWARNVGIGMQRLEMVIHSLLQGENGFKAQICSFSSERSESLLDIAFRGSKVS